MVIGLLMYELIFKAIIINFNYDIIHCIKEKIHKNVEITNLRLKEKIFAINLNYI